VLFIRDEKPSVEKNMKWAEDNEVKFKERQKQAQELFHFLDASSNYSDVALSKYIHDIVYNGRAIDLRVYFL
jgi:hypothetical protein